MAARLPIYTQIHSRYRVFDASGHLPFSIVFGFCRRATTDIDTRALILEVSGSVLDVPYALANGLLTLHERDPHDTHHYIDVDLSGLSKSPTEDAKSLSLSSPVNRVRSWRDSFTTYLYSVDVGSKLASILEPGKKYSIRLATQDLGVKRWAYSDHEDHPSGCDQNLSQPPEDTKLVNSKSTGGNATFTVVQSLPWPPRIETRMRFAPSGHPTDSPQLGISVTNTGERSVTVQTRNEQRFLIPWGPMQPLHDLLSDSLPRIVDTNSHNPPTSSLQLFDSATGQVVRGNFRRGVCLLKDPNSPKRPKSEWLVTLKPGEAVLRQVGIERLVSGLEDGSYRIEMKERGCWWCEGEVEADSDGRVPEELYNTMLPPLMLETEDVVDLRIRDGKAF